MLVTQPNFRRWLFVAVVFLAGCSNLDLISDASERNAMWSRQLNWLKGLDTWQASGQVAVRSADDGGSASMIWRQTPSEFSLRLHGPFGQGAVLIEGDAKIVSLRSADGQIKRAGSAEELLFRELGWSVPVTGLRYWILGRPAPGYPTEEFRLNEMGLVEHLTQAGWQVTYLRYREAGQGMLPAKIELRRDSLLVRVVLSDWRLSP